ncbi:unnamed protein product [Rotaria sp. Silwood2]|nr:unnamed protein product [Rotaria sp. Silwood2]
MENNFQLLDNIQVDTQNTSYDYDSVMHYERTAFSKNGSATIEALQANVKIGQRLYLSATDIQEVQRYYNCTASGTTLPSTTTTITPTTILTTYRPEVTGDFSVVVTGPARVTFARMNSYRTTMTTLTITTSTTPSTTTKSTTTSTTTRTTTQTTTTSTTPSTTTKSTTTSTTTRTTTQTTTTSTTPSTTTKSTTTSTTTRTTTQTTTTSTTPSTTTKSTTTSTTTRTTTQTTTTSTTPSTTTKSTATTTTSATTSNVTDFPLWNPYGVTVAGGNGAGSAANQLNYPRSVAVTSSGDVYVADTSNNRIQLWKLGATQGE